MKQKPEKSYPQTIGSHFIWRKKRRERKEKAQPLKGKKQKENTQKL